MSNSSFGFPFPQIDEDICDLYKADYPIKYKKAKIMCFT